MIRLRGLKLLTVGAVCLLLLFAQGCSGKGSPRPGDRSGQGNNASIAPEKTKETRLEAKDPATQDEKSKSVKEKAAAALEKTENAESFSKATAEEKGQQSASSPDRIADAGNDTAVDNDADDASDTGHTDEKEHPTVQKQKQEEKEKEQGEIVLNFDNADLAEVIQTLAELLDINYLLNTGVGGSVTIHTAGELNRSDLFPVFYQILETNGLTAVKKGSLYRIVPIKDASRMPIAAKLIQGGGAAASGGQMIIQLIQLDSIAASEMTKVLEPFVSANGTMVTLENANILMVVDHADNMDKILRLVDAFDTNIFEDVRYRFYPLDYADAESLVKILGQVFESYGTAIQSKTNLIAITRLNALLAISPKQKIIDEIGSFIKEYDVPSTSTETGIFVYSIENGRAEEIADILKEVFTGRESDEAGAREKTYRNPLAREAKASEAEKEEPSSEGKSAETPSKSAGGEVTIGSGSLRGEVKITADEVRNNLIIEANPADYQVIKNLLQEIDILPRQVLIGVTIAEVTLDKDTEMGVEWSYVKSDESLSTSMLEATLGDSGLRYTIGNADRWTSIMSALASENKVNILSSPSVLASNSESANIDISTEIPVASSQYEYTSGDSPLVSTNIEYRDTGVMLDVTPHINKNGIVTMEISQEVSEQAQSVQVGKLNYPSFFKRSADTILTVKSGQTIVIGGLIRENRSDGVSGAPWFINIPIIKYFFGRSSKSYEKTELILMITPHVITCLNDVDAVTYEFKDKLGSLFQEGNDKAILYKD